MQKVTEINRRTFLKVFLGIGLFVIITTGLGYRFRRPLYRRYMKLRLDDSTKPGILSADEFDAINAVFETISPTPAPSAEELSQFVNWRTSNVKGYYREYREAAQLLQRRAKVIFAQKFVALNRESRERILQEVLPLYTFLPLQEDLPIEQAEPPGLLRKIQVAFETVFFRSEARFKYFVFWDLLMFYWSSTSGWFAVGYGSYPGVPDQLFAYTAPPRMSGVRSHAN